MSYNNQSYIIDKANNKAGKEQNKEQQQYSKEYKIAIEQILKFDSSNYPKILNLKELILKINA